MAAEKMGGLGLGGDYCSCPLATSGIKAAQRLIGSTEPVYADLMGVLLLPPYREPISRRIQRGMSGPTSDLMIFTAS